MPYLPSNKYIFQDDAHQQLTGHVSTTPRPTNHRQPGNNTNCQTAQKTRGKIIKKKSVSDRTKIFNNQRPDGRTDGRTDRKTTTNLDAADADEGEIALDLLELVGVLQRGVFLRVVSLPEAVQASQRLSVLETKKNEQQKTKSEDENEKKKNGTTTRTKNRLKKHHLYEVLVYDTSTCYLVLLYAL